MKIRFFRKKCVHEFHFIEIYNQTPLGMEIWYETPINNGFPSPPNFDFTVKTHGKFRCSKCAHVGIGFCRSALRNGVRFHEK